MKETLMGFNLADYEPVEDRLVKYWAKHPDGRIHTELVPAADKQWVIKASVWRHREDPDPAATGYAEEVIGSTPVNRTSALENCETSAIGRALANMGFAAKGKRPSREEMDKANRGVPNRDPYNASMFPAIADLIGQADDRDKLTAAWKEINRAEKVGQINLGETEALRGTWNMRKDEIVGPTQTEAVELITEAQKKALFAALKSNDLAERDARLKFCERMSGRPIGTTDELTKAEASKIIDVLNKKDGNDV